MADKNLPRPSESEQTLTLNRQEWDTIRQFWYQAGNLLTLAPDPPDDQQFFAFLELLRNTWQPFGDLVFHIDACSDRLPAEWGKEQKG